MMINSSLFILKDSDIPKVPVEFSEESRMFWIEQKRRCIEGYCVGGKWMPPNLYFYINFWFIKRSKSQNSKVKVFGKPDLRDVEWEILTAWCLARGLSGFTNIGDIPENLTTEEKMNFLWNLPTSDVGKPIYNNQAKDLMLFSSREIGKSSILAGAIIAHEWIFNGLKVYDGPVASESSEPIPSINVTFGSSDTKYSNIISSNFRDGYDILSRSGLNYMGKYYPHPFFQRYEGSLKSGHSIIAQYKKKVGNEWKYFGTKSSIRHVTYKNNPFASQGTRNTVMVKDEIGMFENLIETRDNDAETMLSGTHKFGSCFYAGTGGDMNKGTVGAYKIFYNPEAYDIIEFNDRWENKGKIGMFIPVLKRASEFKDENGNTDELRALDYYMKEREIKKTGSKRSYDQYIQYNPLVPSEVFLRSVGNIFPVKEAIAILANLEINKPFYYCVDLVEDKDGNIDWIINHNLDPIMDFPLDSAHSKEGCVVLYEPPKYVDDEIPFGRYIASCDPINHVVSKTSVSLASSFVFDTWTDCIVAEYTARPSGDRTYFSNLRKLLKLYNARVLYENMFKGLYDYFDYMNELYLLLDQPSYIKDVIPNSKVERGKGMHMNKELRAHAERKFYDWLIKKREDSTDGNEMNIHRIKSIPLLKEIIMYDGGDKVNTDRVDACLLLMFHLRQKQKERDIELLRRESNYIYPHNSDFFKKLKSMYSKSRYN